MSGADRTTAWLGVFTAVVGLIAAILTTATQLGAFGDVRVPGLPGVEIGTTTNGGEEQPPGPEGICNAAMVSPTLGLSTGRGPSGTLVAVTGNGYCPDAVLEIRFHTRAIGEARTDGDGEFSVEVTIPGTFDAFAPAQFDIIASSAAGGSARVPFELTTG